MVTLSPKQQHILNWIQQFITEHDYPPTVREIGAGCAIKSTSNVDYHLNKLEAAGHIQRDFNVCRGLRIMEANHVRNAEQLLPTAGR